MYHCFTDLDFRWTMLDGLKMLSNRHESFPLLSICHAGSRVVWDTTQCESSRVIKCLIRIDWSLLPHFNTEEDSCITISQTLISGSADWRRASWVESLSASDELIQFGCIGHGCLKLAKRFWKPETITDYGKWKIWNTLSFPYILREWFFAENFFKANHWLLFYLHFSKFFFKNVIKLYTCQLFFSKMCEIFRLHRFWISEDLQAASEDCGRFRKKISNDFRRFPDDFRQ